MEKHVYFVRHGESEANADNIHRGSKAELNEIGKEQAELVAQRIKRIGVEALLSSPWPRARATAEAISSVCGLPIEESELFAERRRPSSLVGLSHHDPAAMATMKEIYEGYLQPDHRHSDEDNVNDLRARANAALDLLVSHSAERICVVTHGIFLRALFAAAFDKNFTGREFTNAIAGLETFNTGISHFKYEELWEITKGNMHWRVVQWNDSAHLG